MTRQPSLHRAPGTVPGWIRLAARPGSGIGFLAASLSVQPLATLGALFVASLAALVLPKIGKASPDRRRPTTPEAPRLATLPLRDMQAF